MIIVYFSVVRITAQHLICFCVHKLDMSDIDHRWAFVKHCS